mgnify:CR=1 FL=1
MFSSNTSFGYFNNTLTITTSIGSFSATINDFTGLTITGPAYYQQNVTNPTNTYEIAKRSVRIIFGELNHASK